METKSDLPWGLTVRGLVKDKENRVLLLKRHPLSKNNASRWELPGGKVDPNEDFDKALIREMMEETNYNVHIDDYFYALNDDYSHRRTVVLIMRLSILSGDLKISDEHTEYKWVTKKDIQGLELSNWFQKMLDCKGTDILFF